MKAIYFEEYGSVDVLQFGERPRPEPGPRQVLIEVHVASRTFRTRGKLILKVK